MTASRVSSPARASLTQAGPALVVLLGANTYTGGTTVSGGTLWIGNGGTTGAVVGNITDNAALVFNRSDNVTFAGNISGTGSLTVMSGNAAHSPH